MLVAQNGFVAGRFEATVSENENVYARNDGVDPRVQDAFRYDLESQLFRDLAGKTPLWRFRQLELPARQLPFVALVTEEDYSAAADDNSLHGDGKPTRVVIARGIGHRFGIEFCSAANALRSVTSASDNLRASALQEGAYRLQLSLGCGRRKIVEQGQLT